MGSALVSQLSVPAHHVAEMGDSGPFADIGTIQLDRGASELVEEPYPAAEQDGHQVEPDLVEEPEF